MCSVYTKSLRPSSDENLQGDKSDKEFTEPHCVNMRIAFCHHLSLSYFGGGEKWLISVSKELAKRGHDVEIYALPFKLEGKSKVDPKEYLEDIPYKEALRHKVKADLVYVTYNPLSWLNFET